MLKKMDRKELLKNFDKLLDIIETLREQCPWDKAQTPETIRPLTIEETYELAQAITQKNFQDFKKELGDVLLHIILYAKMADEKQKFNLNDVFVALSDKLIFRHPHIFSDVKAETPEEVSKLWEAVKLKEKNGNKTVLGGIPDALPALIKAYRIQDKASNAGFDWQEKKDVWPKVYEEINELKTELEKGDTDKAEAEFGDFIFATINAGRLYGINPENALERTNQKFISRFNYIEQNAKKQNKNLKNMTLDEMDSLWNQAKSKE